MQKIGKKKQLMTLKVTMKETKGTVNHRKVELARSLPLVNNRSMTVSLSKGLLVKNSLIPGKGKSKKVTLRESGIISINYPEPFLLGKSQKEQEKSWVMIQVLILCFMIQEFDSLVCG